MEYWDLPPARMLVQRIKEWETGNQFRVALGNGRELKRSLYHCIVRLQLVLVVALELIKQLSLKLKRQSGCEQQ